MRLTEQQLLDLEWSHQCKEIQQAWEVVLGEFPLPLSRDNESDAFILDDAECTIMRDLVERHGLGDETAAAMVVTAVREHRAEKQRRAEKADTRHPEDRILEEVRRRFG